MGWYRPWHMHHPGPVPIHVTADTGLLAVFLAGFIGGLTILVGVVVTEVLVRFRERRRALETSMWEMHMACGSYDAAESDGAKELAHEAYTNALAQIRGLAKWPVRHRDEIVREVDKAFTDYAVAVAARRVHGTPVRLGSLRSTRLNRLIMGDRDSTSAINAGLQAAGYPPIDNWGDPAAWPTPPASDNSTPPPD